MAVPKNTPLTASRGYAPVAFWWADSQRVPRTHPTLQRAAEWLITRQKPDGGWGEHFTGCLRQEYAEHPVAQATMTSWAVLALCEIVGADHSAVARGAAWLTAHQSDRGSYPRAAVNGVFFGTAMLDYDLYRAYFPVWALAAATHSGVESIARK